MYVPIHSFKFFAMEINVYQYTHNPAESLDLNDSFSDGYLEIQISITKENFFICPGQYKVLLVRPQDGRRVFIREGNLWILGLAPLEQYQGFEHLIKPNFSDGTIWGADFINITTKSPLKGERTETLALLHNKGVLVPEDMFLN